MAESTYSLIFDGSSGYVIASGDSGSGPLDITGSFSVSVWLYVTANSNYQLIAGRLVPSGGDPGRQIAIFFAPSGSPNQLYLALNGVYSGAFTSVAWMPNINTWQHFCLTYDGSAIKVYLNGVFQNSASASGSINSQPGAKFTFGADTGNNNYYFAGNMDDAAVWNVALSSTDVANLAAGTSFPQGISSGLVGLWHFEDGGSGTNVADSSGSGNTGTLTGGVTWSSDVPSQLAGGGPASTAGEGGVTGHASITVPINLAHTTGAIQGAAHVVASSLRAGVGSVQGHATIIASSLRAGSGTIHGSATVTVTANSVHAVGTINGSATVTVTANSVHASGTVHGAATLVASSIYSAEGTIHGAATARVTANSVPAAGVIHGSASFIASSIYSAEGVVHSSATATVPANLFHGNGAVHESAAGRVTTNLVSAEGTVHGTASLVSSSPYGAEGTINASVVVTPGGNGAVGVGTIHASATFIASSLTTTHGTIHVAASVLASSLRAGSGTIHGSAVLLASSLRAAIGAVSGHGTVTVASNFAGAHGTIHDTVTLVASSLRGAAGAVHASVIVTAGAQAAGMGSVSGLVAIVASSILHGIAGLHGTALLHVTANSTATTSNISATVVVSVSSNIVLNAYVTWSLDPVSVTWSLDPTSVTWNQNMPVLPHTLLLYVGEDWNIGFSPDPKYTDSQDVTTWNITFTMGTTDGGNDILNLSVTGGEVINTSPTTGEGYIPVPRVRTLGIVPQLYFYEIRRTDAGRNKMMTKGKILVQP